MASTAERGDHARTLVRPLTRRVAALAACAALAGIGAGVAAWLVAYSAIDELAGAVQALAVVVATAVVWGAIGAWLAGRWSVRWSRREVVMPMSDLTEQLRAAEAQRARVEKMATVGHMAAGIAHEVGNPLAAIAGYAHVLRSRTAAAPDAAVVIDALERETERIDRIVRGLLDFARPRRVTPTAIDVNAVLADVRRLLADQGVLRRVQVDEELDTATPLVFGERPELEQVFVNLLLNAADATDRTGRVALRTRTVPLAELSAVRGRAGDAPGEYIPHRPHRRVVEWLSGAPQAPETVVQIVVADSGPGVPAEDAERVFDPFYTTKSVGAGTGLGLAVVARIVDASGGAVWVQRAREGGAAFVVVLPQASGRSGHAAVGPDAADRARGGRGGNESVRAAVK